MSERIAGKGAWAALAASFLGWTLDAFDFFLVVFCLTSIAKDFHASDAQVAFSITLTLAFRPVGAIIFGLMADRYGRRLPLMLDLIFYSVVEVATGLAPTFTWFLVLRALFGIGMGGEWGVGASLAMEKVPPKWRGLLSGLLQQGYAFGNLLAALCYLFLFPRFGWRPLFFIGGLPALLALFVRLRVTESESWQAHKGENWSSIGTAVRKNLPLFFYMVVLMAGMNLSSHGTQDMYPTFLQRSWHMNAVQRSLVSAISMIGAIVGGLAVGRWSDMVGRKWAIAGCLFVGILIAPLWSHAPNVGLLVAGAVLIQFVVQGAWGVIPAHLSEMAPPTIRGFLPGFAYQCGALLAGSIGYFEALLAEKTSYPNAMGITAGVVFGFAGAVALMGRVQDRRGDVL